MKHFKNIKSFEDLKNQFKALARKNHPDAGGDPEVMKDINGEYDQLFPIWKHKFNTTAPEPTKETADSTRSEFYTAFGWKGSKHDWSRSTKEVAALVRAYVKEVYPTYKFSVRFSSASMCSEIHVELKEAPHGLYKSFDELNKEEIDNIHRKLRSNHLFNKDSWYDYELKTAILEAWEKSDFYKTYNDLTTAVIEDVNREVNSYNYSDCDGMTDYFHVDFYYFGCKVSYDFKVVEKSARIKDSSTSSTPIELEAISNKNTYDIAEDTDTRDDSKIWVVKVKEKVEDFSILRAEMKKIDGYYSKFKHGFIFRYDPTEVLNRGNGTTTEKPAQDKPTAQPTQRDRTKTIERINKAISNTQSKIDKLSGDYKTNTYKRMREQEGREAKIQSYKQDLNIFSYLLDTVQERDLTSLETALLTESFRDSIHSYYKRFETWNLAEGKRPSSARPVEYPEKDPNYLNSWWNEEVPKIQKRLQKANISNTQELVKAIEEYKAIVEAVNKPQDQTALKIKRLERECKMMQKGDINFTPSEVAKILVELARISEGDKVLEPSAGIASIADEIQKVTTNIDVVEQMSTFRELLILKGYNLVGDDFIQYQSEPIYDAIIMNPPFSDEQNHIKHAYDLLKDGGTLVSISSPHWTFANDKKSVEFREWLEDETYFTEDLKSGTFEMTGVASKIIVIEKRERDNIKTA